MAEATVSRLTVLEKGLAVVTAVLALGTGFLGYKSTTISQARDQAQAVADNRNSDLSSLQENYNALQAENARLRAQLGLPLPTADLQASTDATVRHSGQLVLALNRNADLDSPSSDPQWDTDYWDISYEGSYIDVDTNYSAAALYLGNKKADYKTGRNTTGYSGENLNTVVGSYICIKTDQGRYSALRIAQLDSSKITFDVVTYDPPDK
jgi:hypothetical protein